MARREIGIIMNGVTGRMGTNQHLMRSIVEQIIPLGDETQVLSGHGDPTTVGRERKVNPFLRSYDSEA